MNISGMEKVSLSDYPGMVATVLFTQGCNFNCSYCQNSSLIPITVGKLLKDEIFSYLKKRKNIIDAVVISGGEPLLQNDLREFILEIKKFGLKIKLDTNGFLPNKLKKLLDENLLDYVAMDIKHTKEDYGLVSGVSNICIENIFESIKLIESSGIDYEFRTTLIKNYHDVADVLIINSYIKEKSKYFLQNFTENEYVIDKSLKGFDEHEFKNIYNEVKKNKSNIQIRGM